MKFSWLIVFFFLFAQASIAEKKSSSFLNFFLQDNKKPSSSNQSKKKNSRLTKSSPYSKVNFLRINYYKSKNSREQIRKKMTNHLNNIEAVCELTEENKKEVLNKELENFTNFLEKNLKDPHLFYSLKLKFGDILDTIETQEDQALISAEDFMSSYSLMYNLPENIKVEDYPNHWAKVLYKSLSCVDPKTNTNDKDDNGNDEKKQNQKSI